LVDPAQAAACELAQELRPDRFGLGYADLQAQNLAPPVRVDDDGADEGDRYDPSAAPDLELGGVDLQVRHALSALWTSIDDSTMTFQGRRPGAHQRPAFTEAPPRSSCGR
jgi:hypothetical protein